MPYTVEEQKFTLTHKSTPVLSACVLRPVIAEKEKLTAFYAELAERLLRYINARAEEKKTEFDSLPRRERFSFAPVNIKFLAFVDEGEDTFNISCDFAENEGRELLHRYGFSCLWDKEREIIKKSSS